MEAAEACVVISYAAFGGPLISSRKIKSMVSFRMAKKMEIEGRLS